MPGAVDLAPQKIDEHLEIVAAHFTIAPHRVEQPVARDDPPRRPGQALQNGELRSGQFQLTVGPRDSPRAEIDGQVRKADMS